MGGPFYRGAEPPPPDREPAREIQRATLEVRALAVQAMPMGGQGTVLAVPVVLVVRAAAAPAAATAVAAVAATAVAAAAPAVATAAAKTK
jgi:hypothetical protein